MNHRHTSAARRSHSARTFSMMRSSQKRSAASAQAASSVMVFSPCGAATVGACRRGVTQHVGRDLAAPQG